MRNQSSFYRMWSFAFTLSSALPSCTRHASVGSGVILLTFWYITPYHARVQYLKGIFGWQGEACKARGIPLGLKAAKLPAKRAKNEVCQDASLVLESSGEIPKTGGTTGSFAFSTEGGANIALLAEHA